MEKGAFDSQDDINVYHNQTVVPLPEFAGKGATDATSVKTTAGPSSTNTPDQHSDRTSSAQQSRTGSEQHTRVITLTQLTQKGDGDISRHFCDSPRTLRFT